MALVDLSQPTAILGGVLPGGGGTPGDIGSFLVTGNVLSTPIATINTFTDLNLGPGGILGSDNTGWSIGVIAQGSLQYDGVGMFNGVATIVLSGVSSASPLVFEFIFVKDGFAFPEMFIQRSGLTNVSDRVIVLKAPVSNVEPGERIRCQVRNLTSSENATFIDVTFRIDPLSRFVPSTAVPSVFLTGATFAVSTATDILGFKSVYGCTDTTVPRTLTISSLDIALGTPSQPWVFSVTDQSGGAGANAITIDTEGSELIDGAAAIVLTENFASVTLYSDGSNLFSR